MKNMNRSIIIALLAYITSFPLVAEDKPLDSTVCLAGDKFHKAAAAGDTKMVQACLDAGTAVDAAEGNGWTALHAAAFKGKEAVAKLLLQAGAKTTLQDENGQTPKGLADKANHTKLSTLLAEADKMGKQHSKKVTIACAKAEALAEALRYELNNYGPASSNDEIDYQVAEIVSAEKIETDAASGTDTDYTITVKFKTGVFHDGSDIVVYRGDIVENGDGHISVTKYEYAEK